MAKFSLGQREIIIPNFSDQELKSFFDARALVVDFVGDVIVLGLDAANWPELSKIKNTMQIDGNPFATFQRILAESSNYCSNSYALSELQNWSWQVRAILFDRPADRFAKSLSRTLFFERGNGKISTEKASYLLSKYAESSHEEDLTPESKRKFERFYAHDVILKDVPDRLTRERYEETSKNLGFHAYSDKKVREFASNFHRTPISCEYMAAEKIAEMTVHLRRAETILSQLVGKYNKPRNPLDAFRGRSMDCYFCKVKGDFGVPPFTSLLNNFCQTPICDNCLNGL